MKSWKLGLAILVVLIALTVAPATAQTFDNSGGGSWKEYMSFPITTVPAEHAQYRIVINGTTWELYNSTNALEATGTNNNFWNLVNSTGADIRVFNDKNEQLYFWIEYFNPTEQKARIIVKLTANSSELNIAYGNPSATLSSYHNASQVFEFFDDFETLDTNVWGGDTGSFSVSNGILSSSTSTVWIYTKTFSITDAVVETKVKLDTGARGSMHARSNQASYGSDTVRSYSINYRYPNGDLRLRKWLAQAGYEEILITTSYSYTTDWHIARMILEGSQITIEMERFDGTNKYSGTATDTSLTSGYIGLATDAIDSGAVYYDWVRVLKVADPADFGTGIVKTFQERFGTKTVYVNVTYLDTSTTERYNPTAYYKLEDKPQINVTSSLSISGVNATYGANVSIELIEFVTLDKVVYNGTDVTANLVYQGNITNATTGYVYNVYNFTTYEDGTLEIYGHVANKAYEAVFKLDRETVDIFNTPIVVGEPLEIVLPHKGNVTIDSLEHIGVSAVSINTKDLGVGAKSLSIEIRDPENFTVGYRYGTINIDWGKVNANVLDLQDKPLDGVNLAIFNKDFAILSSDTTKLYAGNNTLDIYFHNIKLKSVEFYLNHSNNNLVLNITVNATQPTDYREIKRIIASPNYFEVLNLSAKYPFSVMKLVNASGTVVIDYVSNAPTSVEVVGATSYSYEKPVLKITVNGNVTVSDLYKLTTRLKDRLDNPVDFYILINGSRVDASNGIVSKLLKVSWYEVEVPVTVAGFVLWKFNDTSNVAQIEVKTDVTLPTAEYRVPTKFETKEVRIQKMSFGLFPFTTSEAKPAQDDETPMVRLQGSLKDFYSAPIPNKNVTIEIASPNFTRIYNVTTDNSGNFKIDVDLARGVEYTVTYKFGGDDVYVGTTTSKTIYVEELPVEEIIFEEVPSWILAVVIVLATVGAIVAIAYVSKRTKAQQLARMENEFKFFRRLK